jgi:hypothetical protein
MDKNFKHIYTLEIPKYITSVQTSKVIRPKYYSNVAGTGRVNKCPKRLGDAEVDAKGFYIDKNGNRIIANTRNVGKPRLVPINAQILYVGSKWNRAAIKNGLEEFYIDYIKDMPVFTGSIVMESEIHTVIGHDQGDLDNLGYMYGKVLLDTMVNMGRLVDDKVPYVTKPCSAPLFYPVDSTDDRKLIFHFYQDERPEILKLHKVED